MSRKLRLEYPGAQYHVLNRGNYRQDLFKLPGAAEAFERCLFEACERYHWRVYAFVIMRNHFHIALETPEPNLSEGMKFLQGTWANRFNRFNGVMGRPFQGRYKALHVEPGAVMARVVNYIHLNPVRAGLRDLGAMGGFRWSSLWWFARGKIRPAWLVPELVLRESGGLPDNAYGWRMYRDYLGLLEEKEPMARVERYGRLSRGWALGAKEFKQGLVIELKQREELPELGVPAGGTDGATGELREAAWERKLRGLAEAGRIDLERLGAQKSEGGKVLLAAAMKASTAVSNRWLCERLGMGTPASVSQYVSRWMRKAENRRELEGVLRIKT